MIEQREKIFRGEVPIKYVFDESSHNSKYLIIVFSAFSPEGQPPKYNYYKTIQRYDCNKLFILDDYGGSGCYYLGENRDFFVERSVIRLIEHICKQYNISRENILACGSSKGGYSALYFSIKYNFGHVVVCAPQFYVGDFLSKRETILYIAGDRSIESINFLNNLLTKEIEAADTLPNINIHVGVGDSHYKDHVIPLKKVLEKKGHEIDLDVGNFVNHNEVLFYQRYLKKNIREIITDYKIKNDGPVICDVIVNVSASEGSIKVKTLGIGEELKYAWYLFKDKERIDTAWYEESNEHEWNINERGIYRVVSFIKDKQGDIDSETSDYIYLYEEAQPIEML